MVLANLRVQHGPLVATLVEGHHEGALHAACGRSRAPGVMTTTLRVNAQELQVRHHGRGERARCASLWQQGRIVSAYNS